MIKTSPRRSIWSIVALLGVLLASGHAIGQTDVGPTTPAFHTFQPAGAPYTPPDLVRPGLPNVLGMTAGAAAQIASLEQDKLARTPAQQKIDSNVIYTIRMMQGRPAAPGVPYLYTGVTLDVADRIVVDLTANVTKALTQKIAAAGGEILQSNESLRGLRAVLPPASIEAVAASNDVVFVSPMQRYSTARQMRPANPGFAQRAANVRKQLGTALPNEAGTPITWQGSVGTEGDLTHRAYDARGTFGVDGTGLKIGVLSDGVTSRALSQASGDLPPNCGTPPCLSVLAGQAGAGDEGTAMMEIIHDMAPGASLYFATANNSITSFAANIRALQAAGCQIIVDDVNYFVESPFQDGQTAAVVSTSQGGVVTQAVNDVAAAGAFYFSSAGNQGNLDSGTSGTYEGDFVPLTASSPLPTGNVHNFGSGNGFDTITSPGEQVVGLFWADPLGASGNDYDLYLLNSTGASIVGASTNIQNGTQDPVELIGSTEVINDNRLVVFQHTGAANRFFHLELFRGTLAVSTSGETHGHSAASGAYTVAATPAATSWGAPTPNGPYPGPFTSSNQIENFSSDGLRHNFFNADSTAITPGNFSATGGAVLNKPDITAADGVSVTGAGGFGSPFFGTSASAPSAAAVAALVLAAKPSITAGQMRTALTSTAIDIMAPGFDRNSGSGIVMAVEAISSLGVPGTANPQLGTITGLENPGNRNGIIEPGEGAALTIQLKNAGVSDATNVTATLTTTTPGVTIMLPGTSAYPNLPVGTGVGNNRTPFLFTLASSATCGLVVDFTLTVSYNSGSTRLLYFYLPTGYCSISNTLAGPSPTGLLPGVTFATGTQTSRIVRDGVMTGCGTPKAFPGAITGSHAFDSYSFTATRSLCLEPILDGGAAGENLFESLYTPSFVPTSIGTNYAGDAGLSTSLQDFDVDITAGSTYTIVINDVAGNPLPPPAPPNSYTLYLPICAFSGAINQVPVALAHDVRAAAGPGGAAGASIDNGSYDPDGDPISLTQTPPGPYPVGTTTVILTATDPMGAFSQATAVVSVVGSPVITKAFSPANILVGGTSTMAFTLSNPATNTSTASSLAFTDTFPAGLQVATSPNATNGCAGTFTAPVGAKSVSLAGAGPLSPGGSCTVTVDVVALAAGVMRNVTSPLTSAEVGTGFASNVAVLKVCSSILLGPATLTGGTVGTAYSQTVTASGGAAPYTYSQTSGYLPTGLTLNSGTGTITGTPSTKGIFSFVVTVTDAQSCTTTATYTISVGCPITLAPSTLPNGTIGTAYSQTLTATGAVGSVTFASTGSVPPGLSLSAAGVLSGTPTTAGTYSFTVTATDSQGCSVAATYTVTIGASSSATTTTLTTSLNPSLFGKAVTFTASVVATTGTATPTGTVNFSDGTVSLGTATLDGAATATFTTSSLAVGNHTITAAYAGSASFSPSTSAPLTQVVLTTGGCPSGDNTTACIFLSGRFHVQVQWTNPYDLNDAGMQHPGYAIQLTGDTAYFWFFAPTNMELLVKAVDGRLVSGSGKIWFFWGAMTDVEYWITVTDTQTGRAKTYHNPPKTLGSGYDTGTFSDAPLGTASTQVDSEDWLTATLARGVQLSVSELLGSPERMDRAPVTESPLARASCTADDKTLCLNESRFQVRVAWKNYTYQTTGDGHALPVTSDSGCFWFFQSANIELAIKVLDGRAANGKYWVLYGALTDVEYTITITDTVTGTVKTYLNPAHTQASFADTSAFLP